MDQTRYRRLALAALAISFAVVGGFSGTAAAQPPEGRGGGRAEAPGQVKQAETAAVDEPSSEPHDNGTGPDDQEFAGGRPEEESPGGQGCDGTTGSDTGNGANTDGPDNSYHNTCDGSAAQNGGGNGVAGGQPCAGCVGNADDKNPPGQYKDGGDANSGYECDPKGQANGGNTGVGASNPAHTGCTPGPSGPQPCPDGKMPAEDGTCAPLTCPDGSEMPANGKCDKTKTCPDGSDMPKSGTCDETGPGCDPETNPEVCGIRSCPTDTPLPAGGACETPPPPAPPAPTSPSTGASVGPAVQGSVFGRPAEVLGVQITRGAPAALARTGAASVPLVQVGLALTALGLGLVVGGRTRRRPARS